MSDASSSSMWMTATLRNASGPCACPEGCSECVYRSPSVFGSTAENYVRLDATANRTDVRFDGTADAIVTDAGVGMTECPAESFVECMACDVANKYYPAVFAGGAPVMLASGTSTFRGTGVVCLYDNECDTLSAACGINFTFIEFFETCGWLFAFFLLLLGVFQLIRSFDYMLHTCDPNLYMQPDNPKYPPFQIPEDPRVTDRGGRFAWLVRAWRVTDTDILKHCTPDELMMLRWFRMLYVWFFGGSLFCAPVLMSLYYVDSRDFDMTGDQRAELGMKRVTIAAAHSPYVFWCVVAEIWALSIWLVFLMNRETKAYTRLIWRLGPNKLGIKSHAILVKDIPMLTTEPVPASLAKRKKTGMLAAINRTLANKKNLEEALATPRSSPAYGRSHGPPPTIESILAGEEEEEDQNDPLFVDAEVRAGRWLRRHYSEVRRFINETTPEDVENLRACTRTELELTVKTKLEGVLGEGCVVSCMMARDTRPLDAVSQKYQAANTRHLQAVILEAKLEDELRDAEAEAVRALGGLGRLPTFKGGDFDDDLGGIELGAFDANGAAADDGGESGGISRSPSRSATDKEDGDPALEKLRAAAEWARRDREGAAATLREAQAAFDAARSEFINDESPSPSGVVVFSRQMDAVIAGQVQIDSNFGSWHTEPAPGPNDVVWHNVALTSKQRWRKNMKARLFAGLMVVFFMVPVNFLVAAIASGRQEIVDGLGEGVYRVLVGLILTVFLVIGHIASLVLSRQYGFAAVSQMDVAGASIYFWLLVLNLFLGNLSDRPVWEDLLDWVQNPSLVLTSLLLRVVETSSFFLQFCMLRIAQSCPLELIHPPFHLGYLVKTLVHLARSGTAPTPRMVQNWTEPENTPLHRVPAQTMMVVFLGMMYCVTAPFFLPVCGVFFAVFYLFWKHNLCYHYMQPYQSGQTLWGWLMKNTFTCLMVSQVILLLGLPTLVDPVKGEYTADYIRLALLPLPFVSTMQMLRTKDILKQSHKVPVHKQAAETGEREDENEAERNTSFDERGVVGDLGALLTTTRSPAKLRQAADSAPGKKTFNVVGEGAMKYTKKMNTTVAEAKAEVQRLIDTGKWRTYQPISIWPLVNEKAAASLIFKRWRENKHVKLRIARRKADEAMPGLFAPAASGGSPAKLPSFKD